MRLRDLWTRLRQGWASSGEEPPTVEYPKGEPREPPGEPAHRGYIPPGARPVIVKQEEARIGGIPGLVFRRREVVMRDDHNAKYSHYETNPVILACGCVVSSPRDVAGLSDVTRMPICRRCVRICLCGHRTAPAERVMLPGQGYLCIVCHAAMRKQQRRAAVLRFFLGCLVRRE